MTLCTSSSVLLAMSAPRAGPELPPHLLAKRKRQAEVNATPSLEVSTTHGKSPSSSPDSASKRRRVIGPAPPPAPLDERPTAGPNVGTESSDSEDDFGPSLPSLGKDCPHQPTSVRYDLAEEESTTVDKRARRDDWMTMPPKQDDLAARLDPTKLRAKGFNTGKGAKGSSQGSGQDNAIWTETPEQKRKRLEDEILGVSQTSSNGKDDYQARKSQAADEEKARKIREHNVS